MLLDVNPGDFVYANVTALGVYDGDTCYLDVDFGMSTHHTDRSMPPPVGDGELHRGYRLLDIDAPELRPLVTRAAGTAARDYLATLIIGKPLLLRTFENPHHDQADSFGRYLAWLRVFNGTVFGFDVNRDMLDSGHAIPYNP